VEFSIQVSHPAVLIDVPGMAADLGDAMQRIFPSSTERALLTWRHVPIGLDYRYDISLMVADVAPLLRPLINDVDGRSTVHFGSDTFNTAWELAWVNDDLVIDSTWYGVHGGYEDLLNERGRLRVGRAMFVREWKMLVRTVVDAVASSGISMADASDLDALRDIEATVAGVGVLYAGEG